ncbi:MAG: hypothetical protein H7Z12_05645 [Rhodospirillaceae bacterium]|nr:hypothetical protein [Rhodospirillales bacterium]
MKLPDEEVINRIVRYAERRKVCNFRGAEVSGGAVSTAIAWAANNHLPVKISDARISGNVMVGGGENAEIKLAKCSFSEIYVRNHNIEKLRFLDCSGALISLGGLSAGAVSVDSSELSGFYIDDFRGNSIQLTRSRVEFLGCNGGEISGDFDVMDTAALNVNILGSAIAGNFSIDNVFADQINITDSSIGKNIYYVKSARPTLLRSTVGGWVGIDQDVSLEQSELLTATPVQAQSPLSLAVDHGHFGPASAPESETARLSGMASAHSQVRDSVGGALAEFDGHNRSRVTDLIRNYLTCLGDCAEAVDEVGLGFAAVRLEAQAKHLFEDGMDLLVGEKRAALEELLAVHRHFEGQLSQWKDFCERARKAEISADDAALVAQAAEPLAAGMVKAPEAFAPELAERLRDLGEAAREPGAGQPEVAYGVAQGIANTVNYLGGFVLRVMRKTGKKTTDRLEEELSDEASEKLAKAARLLLRGAAGVLLPLSTMPMFEWIGRLLRFFAEEDGEK